MPEIALSRLTGLLIELRETLDVEHKGWLNLSEKPAKAKLAKAAIALANSGGGLIVLGTREDNENNRQLTSLPRPSEMARYDVNEINASIARYAEPQFHCDLRFAVHPDTRVEHAIVVVPGDISVPVMATRDCNDKNGKVILSSVGATFEKLDQRVKSLTHLKTGEDFSKNALMPIATECLEPIE